MERERILDMISEYITLIETSPELFHDGIDEDIKSLLITIRKYILLYK